MKTVGTISQGLVSQGSRRNSAPKLPSVPFDERRLPPSINRQTDLEIPRAVWSAWIPSNGARELRRALTDEEFAVLNARCAALTPALAPYLRPAQDDEVAEAISNMFAGYPSMRQQGEDVLGRVMCVMDLLQDFPSWAIKQACENIRRHGFERLERGVARIETIWPPTDPEVYSAVEKITALRRTAFKNATALLSAPVETPPAPIKKFTRAEIEAKLGRSMSEQPQRDGYTDTGHAARVAADLAARKAERATE